MVFSALTALALSLPWYGTHLSDLWLRFHIDKIDASSKDFLFTRVNLAAFLDNCRYYFQQSTAMPGGFFDVNLLTIFFCAVFCYLFYYLFQTLVRKQACRLLSHKTLLLLSWIVFPLVVLCLPVFTGIRLPPHLLPALPACALALSVALLRIRLKAVKYVLLGCTLAVAVPYWYINLCAPFLRLPAQKFIPFRIEASLDFSAPIPVHLVPAGCLAIDLQRARVLPSQENWRHRDILDFIVKDYASHRVRKRQPNILLIGGDHLFRYSSFEYLDLQMRAQVLVIDPFSTHFDLFTKPGSLPMAIFTPGFEYVLLRDDPLNKETSLREFIDYLKQQETEFHRFYTEAKQFILPDGSQAILYKRSALYGSGT
jgi:hypothetical protein